MLAATTSDPAPPPASLAVRPWPDAVVDDIGHDPRSAYVERFWLSLLGPTSVLLLRRLANELELQPAGFDLSVEDTARALGVGTKGGRSSPFARTVQRLCQFRLAHLDEPGDVLLARRKIPPLNRGQVVRLAPALQLLHRSWQEEMYSPDGDTERMRRRARHLALSLLELGEDVETSERQLHRWRYHPAIARDAVAWAWTRHQQALLAAEEAAS
jgi:hypothetical protein